MFELIKLIRVLGVRHLLRLNTAKRVGGETLIRGFFATPTINSLFRVGFFDALVREKEVNIEAFAAQRGLNFGVLRPLCDYLYSLKFVDRAGLIYTLSPRGRLLTEELRGAFTIAMAYAPVVNNLESLLMGEMRYGVDVEKNISMAAQGSGEAGKLFAFPMVKELIRRQGFTAVMDLGCGDAAFLADLCNSNGDVTGYGIDLSAEAIENGRRNITEHNLQDRIHLFVEDMFNLTALADQFREVEAATAFFVLHEFLRCGTDRVVGFLREFRAMFPGVALIVCDSTRQTPEQVRKRLGPLAEFQLSHELSGQHTITREQWQAVFAEAGYTAVEEDYFGMVRMVIYTVR